MLDSKTKKALAALITVFTAGLLSLAWLDNRYVDRASAKESQSHTDDSIKEIKDSLKETQRDIKKILEKVSK